MILLLCISNQVLLYFKITSTLLVSPTLPNLSALFCGTDLSVNHIMLICFQNDIPFDTLSSPEQCLLYGHIFYSVFFDDLVLWLICSTYLPCSFVIIYPLLFIAVLFSQISSKLISLLSFNNIVWIESVNLSRGRKTSSHKEKTAKIWWIIPFLRWFTASDIWALTLISLLYRSWEKNRI